MNINELTIGEAKAIAEIFSSVDARMEPGFDNGMIGQYVIVRCKDAGVHAGFLVSHNGRECVLTQSRRLWYWKAKKGAFLSGVAKYGLDDSSKISTTVDRIHLTENCEIIWCSPDAIKSIQNIEAHNE